MDELQIINEHIIIRETTGYDFLKDISVHDLPVIIDFLAIVYNYNKMCRIKNS